MITRHVLPAALLLACAAPAIAQQTLTFDNTSPTITVPLTSPSTVTFNDNGNVHANCQLGPDNRCVGMPASSCPVPPGASLLSGGFSTVADGTGAYPAGTTFTLFPSVTNAEVCERRVGVATPTGTNWSGYVGSGLSSPVSVVLPAAQAEYRFALRCYGAGGLQTSSEIVVRTNNANPPQTDCTGTGGAPGFTWDQRYLQFPDVPWVTSNTAFLQPFPQTGGQLGRLVIPTGKWVSLRFQMPSNPAAYTGLAKSINWQGSQVLGEASLQSTWITVSKCVGDFRVPAAGSAPANDHTLARGCRNLRPGNNVIGIRYEPTAEFAPSTESLCNLKRGEFYYFNMILANPFDGGGIVAGESTCLDQEATQCGIQVRAE